jgi:ABC-type sulfate/molybdate transport systems ATPase subunit
LFVTHDAAEALTIASRVLVLSSGRVVQDASPDELVRAPGSRWVAQLLNVNAWAGRVATDGRLALESGGSLSAAEVPPHGTSVLASLAPTAITLFVEAPAPSARNVWPVHVLEMHTLGGRVRLSLQAVDSTNGPANAVAEVTTSAVSDLGIRAGVRLWASVKATDLAISPR